MPFGYDKIDGKLVKNEGQAAVVKYTFEKVNEYATNPPQEWIDEIIATAAEMGETITREEAINRVSLGRIYEQVWDELQDNPKFAETIADYNRRNDDKFYELTRVVSPETPVQNDGRLRLIKTEESTPIVSREDWEKAQKAMKAPRVAVYCRVNSEEEFYAKRKVAIFVRESSHKNAEMASQRQQTKLNEYCVSRGYEVKDSAMAIGDREFGYEMLLKLLATAEEKGVERIVIATSDRLACTPEEIEKIKELMRDKNITIETTDGSYVVFDYDDSEDETNDFIPTGM